MALRVALFVEGSYGIPNRGLTGPCEALWCETIAPGLGLPPPDDVIPISKAQIAGLSANDPGLDRRKRPAISGAKEPLDKLMVRWLGRRPFDVAVVAWDLVPEFNHLAATCRWQETLELYRLLGLSTSLSEPWRGRAEERHLELCTRPTSGARTRLPVLASGSIVALCMEPMFEDLLADPQALRRALGLEGLRCPDWPTRWDPRRVDKELVGDAIGAAQRAGARLPVRGGFQENKDAWAAYLFGAMLADPEARARILGHALVRRLRELLRPSP